MCARILGRCLSWQPSQYGSDDKGDGDASENGDAVVEDGVEKGEDAKFTAHFLPRFWRVSRAVRLRSASRWRAALIWSARSLGVVGGGWGVMAAPGGGEVGPAGSPFHTGPGTGGGYDNSVVAAATVGLYRLRALPRAIRR